MSGPAQLRYTYERYRRLPEDRNRYEVMDGELFVSPAPTRRHQQLSKRLYYHLYRHVEVEARGGEVYYAPFDVILADDTVVQPDLIYVAPEHAARFSARGLDGAPDLVVEILSPSTRSRDLGLKREVYARFGVQELWLVDPEDASLAVWRLDADASSAPSVARYAAELSPRRVSRVLPELELPLAEVFAA